MKQLKLVLLMFVFAATGVAFGTVKFNSVKNCDCGCEIMKKGDEKPTPTEKSTKDMGEGDEMVCLAR